MLEKSFDFLCSKVPGCIEEVEDLISILPDRIGHATFLLPSHMNGRTDLVDKVIAHKIPIGIFICKLLFKIWMFSCLLVLQIHCWFLTKL